MNKFRLIGFICIFLALNFSIFAQSAVKSQEVSEDDGIPILIKHLPDWENARNRATFTNNVSDLKNALGSREVLDVIDFTGGVEAVTAPYEAGKLLIVEYWTPQVSVEADAQFKQKLVESPSNSLTVYRRIGNYNVFVFDATDEDSANALLDQIKYQKTVQWLGEDPNYARRVERYLAQSTAEIFVTTFVAIVTTLGITLLVGIVVGLVFFRIRDHRRTTTAAFSDAGGMVRLNLDEVTLINSTDKFLGK